MRRSFIEWIKYLLSPAQSPHVRDFVDVDAEPMPEPAPSAHVPTVFRSNWTLRGALRGTGGKPDESTRIIRRRFARYLFNESTNGPEKKIKTWTNGSGYFVQEYASPECNDANP